MDNNTSHYFLGNTHKKHIGISKSTTIRFVDVFTTLLDADKQWFMELERSFHSLD